MTVAMSNWGRYELSRPLTLTLREREIVILRTYARCGCEYDWDVHVLFFADHAGLTRQQVTSLAHGGPNDACWTSGGESLLIRVADALHDTSDVDVDDDLRRSARDALDEPQLLDLTLLCGWYHAINFAARAARVDLEPGAPRFTDT